MSLIYLASPYNHKDAQIRQNRYEQVLEMTIRLIRHNIIVYSPIVHNHFIALALVKPAFDKNSWEFWAKFDTKMLSRCDNLWILQLEGWKESVGIKAEIVEAERLSILVSYIDPKQTQFILS